MLKKDDARVIVDGLLHVDLRARLLSETARAQIEAALIKILELTK